MILNQKLEGEKSNGSQENKKEKETTIRDIKTEELLIEI